MPSRVCSITHCWIALTNSTVSRGDAPLLPRSMPSLTRVIWPMPFCRIGAAFDGSKLPLGVHQLRFCCHTASVCATFSSSVIRDSRSATRASTGSDASLYGGCDWP